MRKWICVVLAGALLACLTGCTVRDNGYIGISVDEAGHLLAVLAWCGPPPDGVLLFHEQATAQAKPTTGNPDDSYIDDATYHAPVLSGQSASFRLDAPVGGWTVTPKPPTLDPAITYIAFGFTNDNTSGLNRMTFKIDDAARVNPGQVLAYGWDDERQQHIDGVISLKDFERLGQASVNCP
ncbi:hypothetical protein GCM10009530_77400 [Microbispora corallina]|uniref:Lipoprotein n=1 Tax=Microbispora corallina TaxID=83302 RepID=A0ABQ4GCN5_9ACTN|nr:hypothetical protein [Microbispora corallina]GIH44733.1 hypothetical protein Mco01_77330 [Microbispora corallina]